MARSLAGVVHQFLANDRVTNAAHPEAYRFYFQMVVFWRMMYERHGFMGKAREDIKGKNLQLAYGEFLVRRK